MVATAAEWAGLEGRVAVITGGASGIGAGIASVLARAGATVVIADRNETGAQREAAMLKDAGHRADSVLIDLGDEASIVRASAALIACHGVPWLLVNNGGVQD